MFKKKLFDTEVDLTFTLNKNLIDLFYSFAEVLSFIIFGFDNCDIIVNSQ